jgi:hypothetical protein
VKENGNVIASGSQAWDAVQSHLKTALELHDQIEHIEKERQWFDQL